MNAPPASDQFFAAWELVPRFREAGDLTLDRALQDARVEDRWLRLPPREFLLLWHLAGETEEPIDDAWLAADLWRSRSGEGGGDIASLLARCAPALRQ